MWNPVASSDLIHGHQINLLRALNQQCENLQKLLLAEAEDRTALLLVEEREMMQLWQALADQTREQLAQNYLPVRKRWPIHRLVCSPLEAVCHRTQPGKEKPV